jgi:hypothetical protein
MADAPRWYVCPSSGKQFAAGCAVHIKARLLGHFPFPREGECGRWRVFVEPGRERRPVWTACFESGHPASTPRRDRRGRELEGGDLLLGLDERTVGDQHGSLAETDGGRIHHARETVTEESVCPSICFVGPFV